MTIARLITRLPDYPITRYEIPPVLACIIAVGTEMLTPFRVDTNSLFITERLNEIGVDVRLKIVAGDDIGELAEQFRAALAWADVVAMTGGLGPTEDDITRAAVARVLEVPLELDEAACARHPYVRHPITQYEPRRPARPADSVPFVTAKLP